MFLYKYLTIHDEFKNTENLLRNNIIRLNKPSEFNDPFDLNIEPRFDIHDEDLKQWLTSQKEKGQYTAEESKKLMELDPLEFYKSPDLINGLKEGALKGGIQSHGIYCLTKVPDSILMWSVYGNKHKGICIRFNISDTNSIGKFMAEVKYSYNFPNVYINQEKLFDQFFLTKFVAWHNEHEVRIVKPVAGGETISLEPGTIDAIVFGIKMESNDKSTVREWVTKQSIRPKLFQAAMVNRDYRIDVSPVEW